MRARRCTVTETRRRQATRRRRLRVTTAALLVVAVLLSGLAPGTRAEAQVGASSFVVSLMKSMAEGAASTAGSDLFGWVLGSAGSADQDAVVLNEILGELDTIENTLQGIETEIGELVNAIDQLDCDSWVEQALPMVNAISNLWDPNSLGAGGPGVPPTEQSYVGIVAETKNNTVTVSDMEQWADQVLNNDHQGINDLSIDEYLQDLNTVLLAPAGGSGVLESCLNVPSNGPSNYAGETDDQYYDNVVAPLLGYYYAIQTQGVTMVVEAYNFQAWQAAGSPTSTTADIQDIADRICGNPTDTDVEKQCNSGDWAVLGEDGVSGTRGRVATQYAFGGAPYTSDSLLGQQPVHRYLSSTAVHASSPSLFSSMNSTNCAALDSNAPCGVLEGLYYTDTTLGGTYGSYGVGLEGTWRAANAAELAEIFQLGPTWGDTYADVGAYLMQERGFLDLPDNTVFLASGYFYDKPYNNNSGGIDVITFTDTGIEAPLPPYFGQPTYTSYFNSSNALMNRVGYVGNGCQVFENNPALPAASENGSFYVGEMVWCNPSGTAEWAWQSNPNGWANPADKAQFRLPVIDITTLTCTTGLKAVNPAGAYTMCGADFAAWLATLVPPAPTGTDTTLDCEIQHPPSDLYPGGPDLPYDRAAIWYGEGEPTKCGDVAVDEGGFTPSPPGPGMDPPTPVSTPTTQPDVDPEPPGRIPGFLPASGPATPVGTLALIGLGLLVSGGALVATGRRASGRQGRSQAT